MAHAIYVVVLRAGQWWVMLDGRRTGPYANKELAIDSAVASAKLFESSGDTSEVAVDEPDDGIPTVYESHL